MEIFKSIYAFGRSTIPFTLVACIFSAVVMMFTLGGLWSLLSIILLGGGLGGFAFSLEDSCSHTVRLPWKGQTVDTGFLGHLLVGISGAFVAIAASIAVLELNVWPIVGYSIQDLALPLFTDKATPPEALKLLVKSMVYTVAVSVVGGYSGLRLISGFSSALLQRVEKELQNVKEDVNKFTKTQKSLELAKIHILMENGEFEEAIELLQESLANDPTQAKAWSWLGRAFRKIDKPEEAIDAAKKAIKCDNKDWIYQFNLACYFFTIADGFYDEGKVLLKKAGDFAIKNEANRLKFAQQLRADPDLEKLRVEKDSVMEELLAVFLLDEGNIVD